MSAAPADAKSVRDAVIRPAKAAPMEPVPDVSVPGGTIGDGADENGWLPLGFDPGVVDTLSTLYGHWTSGLREMYANLVASCKRAAKEYGAEPWIIIAIDGRTITMADIDSCGMSRKVFEEGIAVAGNTGNDDPHSPGQWGLGSLSFVMMSDELLIESHSRATGERFAVQAVRGGRFRTGGLDEPGFEWHGTRMTLNLRDGLDVDEAIVAAAGIASMSGVPTALLVADAVKGSFNDGITWDRDDGSSKFVRGLGETALLCEAYSDDESENENKCGVNPRWAAPIAYYLDECRRGAFGDRARVLLGLGGHGIVERVESAVGSAGYDVGGMSSGDAMRVGDNQCLLSGGGGVVTFHAKSDDLEVAAALGINGRGSSRKYSDSDPYNRMRRSAASNGTWLAGMPISAKSPACLRRFSHVHVHALNERVYMPTPDRERLTDESEERLNADVAALAICEIAKVRFSSLGEYLSDYGNRIVEAALCLGDTDMIGDASRMSSGARRRLEELPLEARRRLGLEPCEDGKTAATGILPSREMRIAMASAAPIRVFGGGKAGDVQTLWSAVRCACGDEPPSHRPSCDMAGGEQRDGPILIVAKTLAARKAAAVIDWCMANRPGRAVVVFRPDKDSAYGIDEYASFGAERIDEYMARHGIRPLPSDDARVASGRDADRSKIMVYGGEIASGWRGYRPLSEAERIEHASADEQIVWCESSGDMEAMKSITAVIPCGTRAAKCARRPGTATPFAKYAGAGGEALYDTTAGRLSGSRIAGTGRRAVLVEYDGDAADLADLLRTAAAGRRSLRRKVWSCGNESEVVLPPIVVIGRGPELAACAAHLHSAGAKYGVWISHLHSGAPEYVSRATADVSWYLDYETPEWLDRLGGYAGREAETRTLIASVLHGHLANMHRKGPRAGGAGSVEGGTGQCAPAGAGGRSD